MNKMSRTLGLIAATALVGGGLVACGSNDVGDRQYCLDTQRDVRIEDNFCESPGEPRYTWVWAERTNYVPGYYSRPGYRYYRYPVSYDGQRTQAPVRPARAATTKSRAANTDDPKSSSSRTTTSSSTRTKGSSTTTGSSGSSGSKGTKSDTKGSSGTKGTSSSGSKGSSSGSKGSSSGSKGSSSGSKGSSSSSRSSRR